MTFFELMLPTTGAAPPPVGSLSATLDTPAAFEPIGTNQFSATVQDQLASAGTPTQSIQVHVDNVLIATAQINGWDNELSTPQAITIDTVDDLTIGADGGELKITITDNAGATLSATATLIANGINLAKQAVTHPLTQPLNTQELVWDA